MSLLSIVDQLFINLESRTQPMHVGGLFLFEPPKDAHEDYVNNLLQQMKTSTTPPSFPFNQVLANLLFWNDDQNFEISQHFRHIALPKPARVRELLHYVSMEHGRLLNKSKPLWECHVIEGIEPESEGRPRRFALYFKIHHSLVDGIAAMRLIQKSLSKDSSSFSDLPLWSLIKRHNNILSEIKPETQRPLQVFKEQVSTVFPVAKELFDSLRNIRDPEFTTSLDAPASILNQQITASRRVSTQSYEFSRFRYIADKFDVTLNDVILAVCSGTLRNYLISQDALPKKPLIAFVPMSLRKDSTAGGNQIAFILANLGTHLHSPVDRLKTIHRSMSNGKDRFTRLSKPEVINYSLVAYAWALGNLALGLFPKKQAFNLIISNVPGSKEPLYWNGAKLRAFYPFSILLSGQAMNITFASYLDKIEFGITACNDVLPRAQDMLKLIDLELDLLEKSADEYAETKLKNVKQNQPKNIMQIA